METLPYLRDLVIPTAYRLLPAEMNAPAATALLLAIGLQESDLTARVQHLGPARGFWQFERAGVAGVLGHPLTRDILRQLCQTLVYPASVDRIYAAIEDNDVLAAAVARLLLWTVPEDLPSAEAVEEAWRQYLSAWRPGRPREGAWRVNYQRAWRWVKGDVNAGDAAGNATGDR